MPNSLISDTQKSKIEAIIDDIHETFARNIVIYQEGEKVLITRQESSFNQIYGKTTSGSTSTTITSVSNTIKARIKYIDAKEVGFSDGNINSQVGIQLIEGSVRITVDPDGFNLLKEAKRVEFEGRKYTISSKGTATGMFGPRYYYFYLKPIEE